MKRDAVLGALWGDEGKGHITHAISPNYSWVIRFNGGANAGHTIYRNGKKYVHNLLPSVDFRHTHIRSYLGAGMVIDLEKLHDEVYKAEEDFPGVAKSIYVDKGAFLVLEKHKEEDKATNGHIGSTNRGIGPAYKSKIGRSGLRIDDVLSGRANKENCIEYGNLISDLHALISIGVNFVHSMELMEDFKSSDLLFEGAQGVMLDINHGIYPYVSCSDCTVSGIAGAGFGQLMPTNVFGVCKVYLTKVGEGPMPTEILGQEAEDLRKLGNEYGATTGRPRRVGWLDLPALKYAVVKSGINKLVLTKFDILNGLSTVKVCHKYETTPVSSQDFFNTAPSYTEVSGWKDAKDHIQILDFVEYVSAAIGIPVELVSCGINKTDIMRPHTGLNLEEQ